MKFISAVFFSCLVCFAAHAGMDKAKVSFSNATTSETPDTVTSGQVYDGYVEKILVQFSTNDSPVAVKVEAYNAFSGDSVTIFEKTISTNTVVYPRVKYQTTAGADVTDYTRIPLIQDNIKYSVQESENTNQNVTIFFYYQREDK